ncbi:hypothetical protein [Corynebacterium sp. 52A]|uniref:hypothetical protein n=1 Tax=Corynebacterium sp. 52A TaxID=2080502 RepID=UPI00124DDD93|nr:hypothetical protein [Corynebacterium sp. 52A]
MKHQTTKNIPTIGLSTGALSITAGVLFLAIMALKEGYSDGSAVLCVLCGLAMVIHAELVPTFPPLARFSLFVAAGITIVATERIYDVWIGILVAALACGGSLLGTWAELWGPGATRSIGRRAPRGGLLHPSPTPAPPIVYFLMMGYVALAALGMLAFTLPTTILLLVLGAGFVAAVCYYRWNFTQRLALSIAALGTISTHIGALLIISKNVVGAIYIWPILALPVSLIAMALVFNTRPQPQP